jgi:tetratricopeptide (TPR) repeat protein
MTTRGENLSAPTQKLLPCLALAAAVFIVYGNIYDNALLFDDTIIITSNEYLRSWHTLGLLLTKSTIAGSHAAGGFYRPLQLFLYFLIYQLSGTEPAGYHLLDVTLHAANATCVFLLGRALGFRLWPAFLGALIWAVHPLHTEAVTYASGTADPLMVLFCLLGLLIMLPDFAPRRIALSIPCLILALLSKEGAVVFPALAVTCIFLRSEKRLDPRTYLLTWPLWLIAGAYAVWRAKTPGFDGPQTYDAFYAQHGYDTLQLYASHLSWRIYTCLATLPAYLALIVWPTHLHMERAFSAYDGLFFPLPLAGLAIFVGSASIILWATVKRSVRVLPLAWGLLWFAVAYFPDTGLIFPMNAQFLEHWMYMPTIGLFLGVAESFGMMLAIAERKFPHARVAAAACAGVLTALFSLHSYEQNEIWHDPFVFYGSIFKYQEVSPRAHNNLALAYEELGNYPAAIAEYEKAIAITDTYAEVRYNLALDFLRAPDQKDAIPFAIKNLNRALEIDPTFYRAWETLGNIYDLLGDKQKAAEDRHKAEMYFNGK